MSDKQRALPIRGNWARHFSPAAGRQRSTVPLDKASEHTIIPAEERPNWQKYSFKAASLFRLMAPTTERRPWREQVKGEK
jgi:hypothetical protein